MSLNKKNLRKHRTKIGMIFQHYNLVSRLTVIENVLHGRFGYKSTLQGVLGMIYRRGKNGGVQSLREAWNGRACL